MKKFRILIVEDNDAYRKLIRNTLQSSFPTIAIEEAADASEALQKLDGFLPDIIFIDIQLHAENGLELTKKIRATHPDIAIFIITFYDIAEYREAASQCGANGFFTKISLSRNKLEELVKSYQKIWESTN
jgi:DNA-binding NarL/FixJ family response regulator